MPPTLSLRRATPADAVAIAAVQTTSWAETYRNLMPDQFLERMTGQAMRQRRALEWQHTLERGPDIVTVVEQAVVEQTMSEPAVSEHTVPGQVGKVVAFASAGATRLHSVIPGDYDAELYTLYALKSAHGLGLGRRLVAASAAALHAQGFTGLALWVLDVNPTRAFYRRLGGQELGRRTEEIPGGVLTEVAVGWRDLKVLLPRKAGGAGSAGAGSDRML